MAIFKDNIEAMEAYVPGEQMPGREVVKLNTNENPYPPSPTAIDVMRHEMLDRLRVYPDPRAGRFCEAVGRLLGFERDWVLAANGSDNLIVMIARAALGPGRRVAQPTPTFPYYQTQAQVEDATLIDVPCNGETFELDIDGLLAANAHVTFVANPNSPTGIAAGNDELRRLAEGLDGLLVIDEAYVDFADETAVYLTRDYANVIVLRTLSKGYSLAGLRLGYAIAQPPLLEQLWKTKEIYNVATLSQAIGLAAIRDQDHKNANAEKVKAARAELARQLTDRDCRVWPSQTNFLLVGVPGGKAAEAGEALKRRNVLIRYFKHPASMADKLRITVGTDEQNDALLAAWDDARQNSEF
jgi:histidinol-phosphate aminotransferase